MELVLESDKTLTLKREGADDVKDVRIRRAFPWSKANEFVSIRDEKGKEIAMIPILTDLPVGQRQLVEGWLAENSFIPMINQVIQVNTDFGYHEWQVHTDRGPLTFRVQEREDIRFLPDGRYSIKDIDGNIYAMPQLARLDQKSQKALEGVL